LRILIADDEAPARERLRRLLTELGYEQEIAGEAADGEEALAACAAGEIDLVLLDIRMPGMDGLQTAGRLAMLDPPPAVILVTAYGEYALRAFEHRVADYLVKPVRRERLQEALRRVQVPSRPQRVTLGAPLASDPNRRRHFTAHYRGGLRTVPIEDVIYLQADQKYVTVRHRGGSILVDESLKALEDELGDLFVRIHRNALVARSYLLGLEKAADGSSLARLRGCDERLAISRRHLTDVRRWLRQGTLDSQGVRNPT
jgi:two-component system response regulator AlgR